MESVAGFWSLLISSDKTKFPICPEFPIFEIYHAFLNGLDPLQLPCSSGLNPASPPSEKSS